ncbi:class I SAM-dependent methyltransferase [Paenibacillus terrigena]|uniref:class I SAM-dependent methyltransferase n=1 Tax=Paenibacillus terrigena TaxID=369333 RepID=UPI0028D1D477|nr:class I SAM-dependent methyltransferase [Paenibacillus terrigena]
MKQNKYDDHGFFEKYSQMPRSTGGLKEAGEWPALRAMLPDLRDKRVLDLGCGFGWHCRYAREQGARSVVGLDLSENMLARARELSDDTAIEYHRIAMEDIDFADGEFDVAISSLALHYIEDLEDVCRKVHHCLVPGGTFILSFEHPIFTARAAQDWHVGSEGERLHWPVDDYQSEGPRYVNFLETEVVKYHRTVATHLNSLIRAGFMITELCEPQPAVELLDKYEGMRDELRRPMFLIILAVKR